MGGKLASEGHNANYDNAAATRQSTATTVSTAATLCPATWPTAAGGVDVFTAKLQRRITSWPIAAKRQHVLVVAHEQRVGCGG